MIDANDLISKLRENLEPLPYIYAFWLEGSYAAGTADEYSDIDFWIDFGDEHEEKAIEAVENILAELAEIDYKYITPQHPHPQIRQRTYHLAGTSEYFAIDFCWQLHSRDEYAFYENDTVESIKVIFDKNNVIKYKPLVLSDFAQQNKARLDKAKYRREQYSRVEKYVRRGQYLEAYAYYGHYVLEPLIELIRLIYTPAYMDYHLIHISLHIPENECKKLEYFAQAGSLDDIAEKIPQAGKWFDELVGLIEGK